MTRFVAIIPARGGSKGIPRKNLGLVGGTPMIAHSIEAAKRTAEISDVYVSTDDPGIAAIARAHGADVIERPGELATDTASSEAALSHALDVLAAGPRGEPDAIVFLQATSPFRRPDDVRDALRTFESEQADSLFSATRAHGFMWRCGEDGPRPLNYDPISRPRRQDAPVDVIENGSIYIFKPSVLRRYRSRLGGKIAVYMMDAQHSFQVDEPWEIDLLSWLMTRGRSRSTLTGTPIIDSAEAFFRRREPTGRVDYEASYWGNVTDPDGRERDRTLERDQHIDDLKQELAYVASLQPGKILDVGCGLGFLLSAIPESWEKHGVELSGFAAERAQKYARVHHGDLVSAKYPADHFDVVVLHHVIEHVEDPVQLVSEIQRVLRPGGKLVLGTPDFDGAMARRYGQNYRLLHDPTHVSLFSNDSMHRFLRSIGFVIEHVDYPFFATRHFTRENLERLFDTSQTSPPFYGSFMTFYCAKPSLADVRSSFISMANVATHVAYHLDETIAAAGDCLAETIARGNKVLACGNGGSAADAQHFVAELVGRLKDERAALPGISLTSDPSVVTCLANDYGYDQVFSRQLQALGRPGDVLLAISTSGRSPNVINAAREARARAMQVVSLTGARGDELAAHSDICIRIPTPDTQCIQELHMAVLHVLCAAIDRRIMESAK